MKVQNIAYDMFLHHLHPPGSVHTLLMDKFTERWHKKGVLEHMSRQYFSQTSCHVLSSMSTLVPARVHLANVRFHFNGWHTAVRYQQRGSSCVFCQQEGSEDSIEHLVVCRRIQEFFPASLKQGWPPTVPANTFFLFGLSDKERLAVSIFMFALYTMHNELRHFPCHTDLNRTIFRVMAEVHLSRSGLRAWEEVFGLRPATGSQRNVSPDKLQTRSFRRAEANQFSFGSSNTRPDASPVLIHASSMTSRTSSSSSSSYSSSTSTSTCSSNSSGTYANQAFSHVVPASPGEAPTNTDRDQAFC